MRGAEFRPRPIRLPNFARDEVGGGSGKGRFTLLPGNTPLGEPIVRRQSEQAKPTLGQEINTYLAERARLRADGQLSNIVDGQPIITPADAISVDLLEYKLEMNIDNHPENIPKYWSVDRILWGFDALAFGRMSQAIQERVTLAYELTRDSGLSKSRPQMIKQMERLNSEEAAILAEQLQKVGLPFHMPPDGITIPFAPTVQKMREIVGGEPLFLSLPPSNVRYIEHHPRRNR